MAHLTILTLEEKILYCSVEACRKSETLKSIIELPRKMLDQMQPIPFKFPALSLYKAVEYLELLAREHFPDRLTVPYFSLSPEEDRFTRSIPFHHVGMFSTAARALTAHGFVHIIALNCAHRMSSLSFAERKNRLGIDDSVPLDIKNKRRSEIGKHILSILGIYKT